MIHESFVQTLPFYSPNDKRMKYQRTWTFDKQALCSLKKKPLNAVLFLTHFSGNHRNRNTVFFPRLLRKIILYFIFFIINKNQNSYETCETLQIDDVMLCPKIRSILWTKYDTFGILPEKNLSTTFAWMVCNRFIWIYRSHLRSFSRFFSVPILRRALNICWTTL